MRESTFSPIKAIETLLYISQHLKQPTIHEVLKIQYFADKLHAQDYGFMPSGDDYVAMQFGPVGSTTYDIIKAARGEITNFNRKFAPLVKEALEVKADDSVIALREPDTEYLSRAQTRCIDEAIAQYGNMPFTERTEISHDEAWTAAWDKAVACKKLQSPMSNRDIINTLPNAQEILEHINT
jgi:uncharacterized phage-associated protein